MPSFSPARKMLCADFSPQNIHPIQPRLTPNRGQDGGMHSIPVALCLGKSGLSRVDLALLAYVIQNPDRQGSRADIAAECDCAPNSIPRAAKKLEAMGLIERVPGRGTEHTRYSLGRNMDVSVAPKRRNVDVARNIQDATASHTGYDHTASVPVSETTTTDMVVTSVTTGRNIPPQTPLDIYNSNTLSQDKALPENLESGDRGGSGGADLFGAEAPTKPAKGTKRRPKRDAFRASEETMPRQPSEVMVAFAKSKGMINGTIPEQYGRFRVWHIRKSTVIASLEQRWETWVNNWLDQGARQVHAPKMRNGVRPNPYLSKRVAL